MISVYIIGGLIVAFGLVAYWYGRAAQRNDDAEAALARNRKGRRAAFRIRNFDDAVKWLRKHRKD